MGRKLWDELNLDRLYREYQETYDEAVRVREQYIGGRPTRVFDDNAMKEISMAWRKHGEAAHRLREAEGSVCFWRDEHWIEPLGGQ